MKNLNNLELERINGGMSVSAGVSIGVVVTAIVVFLSGVIEGITNPGRCNN